MFQWDALWRSTSSKSPPGPRPPQIQPEHHQGHTPAPVGLLSPRCCCDPRRVTPCQAARDPLAPALSHRYLPSCSGTEPVWPVPALGRTRRACCGGRVPTKALPSPGFGAGRAERRTKLCLCGAGEQTAPGRTAGHRPRGTGRSVNARRYRCGGTAPPPRSPGLHTPTPRPRCRRPTSASQPVGPGPATTRRPPRSLGVPRTFAPRALGAPRAPCPTSQPLQAPDGRGPERPTQLSPIDRDAGRPIGTAQISGCPADAAQLSSPRTPCRHRAAPSRAPGTQVPRRPHTAHSNSRAPYRPPRTSTRSPSTPYGSHTSSLTLEAIYRHHTSTTPMTPYNPYTAKLDSVTPYGSHTPHS